MLLYSISNSIEFWLVNHTSIYESNELNIFKNIRFLGEILIIDQATYRQQIYTKLLFMLIVIFDDVTMEKYCFHNF